VTAASELITRVRSNINEPSTIDDPQRSDVDILAWLDQGMYDYVHKVPMESFPELIVQSTFSGSTKTLPTDYMLFCGAVVNHTLSGSTTSVDEVWVVKPGEDYFIRNYPENMGAYCQFTGAIINFGPRVFAGTLTYIKTPTHMTTSSITFPLGSEHEVPIVNYATALALAKVNDADAPNYLALYTDNVNAKSGRTEAAAVERA
jgi:hypothetical protein